MHAPLPVTQFFLVVRIVKREHRNRVGNFDKPLARLAPNTLRGRIRRDQLRMSGFELLQLVHQAVEFRIADLRIVEHVIAVLVMPNLLAQRFDFCFEAQIISLQKHGTTG